MFWGVGVRWLGRGGRQKVTPPGYGAAWYRVLLTTIHVFASLRSFLLWMREEARRHEVDRRLRRSTWRHRQLQFNWLSVRIRVLGNVHSESWVLQSCTSPSVHRTPPPAPPPPPPRTPLPPPPPPPPTFTPLHHSNPPYHPPPIAFSHWLASHWPSPPPLVIMYCDFRLGRWWNHNMHYTNMMVTLHLT